MRPNLFLLASLTLAPLATMSTLTGCEQKKPAATPSSSTQPTPTKVDDHGHDHGDDHSHEGEQAAPKAGHGGAVIDLGTSTVGLFNITKASRDAGEIIAGKDAAFDVTLSPAPGAGVKAAAVRFWIGTEDGKGSVKAKAEVEDPSDPNRWHVHAEVPNPMPSGSRFWFEIEDDKNGTAVGSFDLKM